MADRLRPKDLLLARNPVVKATIDNTFAAVSQETGLDFAVTLLDSKRKDQIQIRFVPDADITTAVKRHGQTTNLMASDARNFGVPAAIVDPDTLDPYLLRGNTLQIAESMVHGLHWPVTAFNLSDVVDSSKKLYSIVAHALLEQAAKPIVINSPEVADHLVKSAVDHVDKLADQYPEYAIRLKKLSDHLAEKLTQQKEKLKVVAKGARLELRLAEQLVQSNFAVHNSVSIDLITRGASGDFNSRMINTIGVFSQEEIPSPLNIPDDVKRDVWGFLQKVYALNKSYTFPQLYIESIIAQTYATWVARGTEAKKEERQIEAWKLASLIKQLAPVTPQETTIEEPEKEVNLEVVTEPDPDTPVNKKAAKERALKKERRRQALIEIDAENEYLR